jgi:hypothetical protein
MTHPQLTCPTAAALELSSTQAAQRLTDHASQLVIHTDAFAGLQRQLCALSSLVDPAAAALLDAAMHSSTTQEPAPSESIMASDRKHVALLRLLDCESSEETAGAPCACCSAQTSARATPAKLAPQSQQDAGRAQSPSSPAARRSLPLASRLLLLERELQHQKRQQLEQQQQQHREQDHRSHLSPENCALAGAEQLTAVYGRLEVVEAAAGIVKCKPQPPSCCDLGGAGHTAQQQVHAVLLEQLEQRVRALELHNSGGAVSSNCPPEARGTVPHQYVRVCARQPGTLTQQVCAVSAE